jgi:hypothetical protein
MLRIIKYHFRFVKSNKAPPFILNAAYMRITWLLWFTPIHRKSGLSIMTPMPAGENPIEDSISEIGEGWVGEEALGIALYCSLKFPHDWQAAALAAINHSGDSDSTGSITGAILGTLLGVDAIPKKWVRGVENAEKIQKIAEGLFRTRS